MTHEHVSSLVTDLVSMAEATKRLPIAEQELSEARQQAHKDGNTIARLERKLMERSAEIDELKTKLRSVEAERDDAGFRELEAQDKLNVLRSAIENLLPSLGETLGEVSGDDRVRVLRITETERQDWVRHQAEKAEAERQEAARLAEEASRPSLTDAGGTDFQQVDASASAESPDAVASTEDQRVADPTAFSPPISDNPSVAATAHTSDTVDGPNEGVSVSSDPIAASHDNQSPLASTGVVANPLFAPPEQLGKYHNRLYRDWPYYVSEASWIAGGGTSESYWSGREGFRTHN